MFVYLFRQNFMKQDINYGKIKEYWKGTLDPVEMNEVYRFLSEPENREEIISYMRILWDENESHTEEKDFNDAILWKKIATKTRVSKTKLKPLYRIQFRRYAAIFLLFVCSIALLYFIGNFNSSQIKYTTVSSNAGERKQVDLPDGTHIWLNGNSAVSYREGFINPKRKVHLRGEAFFEVMPSKNKPFEVETGPLKVIVTGTKFNVTAYPEEDKIITTLTDGGILLTIKNNAQVTLVPGQQAVYSKQGETLNIITRIATDKVTSWKDNKLVFRNETLNTVFESLRHWYGVTFDVADTSILALHYTATVTDESLEEVLALLSHTIDISYSIASGKVVITRK